MKYKLTNEDKATTKKLVPTYVNQQVQDRVPRVADIEALAPYGDAGDGEIMQTLAEGYLDLDKGDIYFTDPFRYVSGHGHRGVEPAWAPTATADAGSTQR